MSFFRHQQDLLMRFGFIGSQSVRWAYPSLCRVWGFGLVRTQTRNLKPERQSYINMIALLICLSAMNAYAQEQPQPYSRLGIGGQAGIPSGLTAKYYFSRDFSVMVVNAWSLDRFLRFSTNIAFEYPIPDSPLHFYVGPGIFYGRENSSKRTDFKTGVTLVLGVNFYIEKFEVFLQANPDLALQPDVSFRLGGVVGLRYFF